MKSFPSPQTFAEGQRLIYGWLAAAAGMFCGVMAVAMIALLMWGGWSDGQERTIVIIFGCTLGRLRRGDERGDHRAFGRRAGRALQGIGRARWSQPGSGTSQVIAVPHSLALKLVAAIGCALMLTLLIHDRNRWKAKTAHYSELLSGERAAHSATVANYRLAAEQARRQDAENLKRVKAVQTAISERTAYDFTSRIAAARARADELQGSAGAAEADPGNRGAAPVPRFSAPARGAAEATGQNRLSRPDALIATEQAIQLDELIKWVKAQSTVDPNGPHLRPAVPQDVPRATGSLRLNYR